MIDFKGSHFEEEIILWGVRWYVAYPISYRQLEEMRGERGVAVDHSTLNRWVIKYAPEVEKVFRRHRRPVGRSWRLAETYVKIKGEWAYLYRAVDKEGLTIDFLLTPGRDRDAAEAFLRKAIRSQGLPGKITIDQSGSNTAAIKHYNRMYKTAIVIRHSKYLNTIVEQDHRAVKRLTRPMLGFQSFWAARCTIAGIEVMHAIRKGQLRTTENARQTPAEQFYALAA
jgi:putative transposase